MKTINKGFLILLVILAATPLFAQNQFSAGYQTLQSNIDTFGSEFKGAGRFGAMVQSSDGGYVMVSLVDSTIHVVSKINSSGQRQWERTLSFTVDKLQPWVTIPAIIETLDHGFVLAGVVGCYFNDCEDDRPPSGATVIKISKNGNVLWKKSLSVKDFDGNVFTSVIAVPDGGVIATGALYLPGFAPPARTLAVRFTASGDVVWKKSYRNSAKSLGVFGVQSVATLDHQLIVASPTRNFATNTNGLDLMKINDSGLAQWKKSIAAPGFNFSSIRNTADNGTILVGHDLLRKLKVIVLKADGTLNWQAAYSLKVPGRIFSLSGAVQTSDGEYVITGGSFFQENVYGFIVKIDTKQKIVFQNISVSGRTFDGPVFQTADGGFALFGGGNVDGDLFLLKLNAKGLLPGCGFLHSVASSPRLPFGQLKIAELKLLGSTHLTLEPLEFGMTSAVTNHQESTLCQ